MLMQLKEEDAWLVLISGCTQRWQHYSLATSSSHYYFLPFYITFHFPLELPSYQQTKFLGFLAYYQRHLWSFIVVGTAKGNQLSNRWKSLLMHGRKMKWNGMEIQLLYRNMYNTIAEQNESFKLYNSQESS